MDGTVIRFDGWIDSLEGKRMQGSCEILNASGTLMFTGGWKDRFPDGKGHQKLQDGGEYDGEYLEGKFHGQGTLDYPNGDQYTGEWNLDRKHGQGTMRYKEDGAVFEGEWKDNTWWDGRLIDASGVARTVFQGQILREEA